VSTPWGGAGRGPCEKCAGAGRIDHRCLSCLELEVPDPGCVACGGRVRWEDVCPSCEGDGQITRVERNGISSFPKLDGLHRYLVERHADLSRHVILELEGELSEDRDLDADEGAILSQPTRIVGCHEVNGLRIRELRNRLSAGHG